MFKAVIFDFGGTVKRPYQWARKSITQTYQISEERLMEVMPPVLEIFKRGEITEEKFWQQLSRALNKPVPPNWRELWRKDYEKGFFVYPEIISLAKRVKERGLKTAILSNTIKPFLKVIEKHKGHQGFDVLVLSCEVGLCKPDPEIYLLTAKKLGVKPEECLFIDNKEEFLLPAKKLGMKTILAKNPKLVVKQVSQILSF